MKALRAWASVLAGVYVGVMMMGGSAFWIMRIAGYGEGLMAHAVRGGVLVALTLVGLCAAVVVARRVWKVSV